jgi:enamine deaminase RidA (YjgF/YER057c/UK114 family)
MVEDIHNCRECTTDGMQMNKKATDGWMNRMWRVFWRVFGRLLTTAIVCLQVLGDAGIHARSAVGTNALPLNVAVEIEAIVEVHSE